MSVLNVSDGRIAAAHLAASGSQYPPKSTGAPWHSTSSLTIFASFALSSAARGLKLGNDRAMASAHHMAM